MEIEKIKPIPKYMEKMILKEAKKGDVDYMKKYTIFYSYLTKNNSELTKVTVAVRKNYSQWNLKQVAVHGLDSEICYVKDLVFYRIAGYRVGWHAEGLTTNKRWWEDGEWDYAWDNQLDPYAPVLNKEYALKIKEFKYSAINLYDGEDIIEELRLYREFPIIEYVLKLGLTYYASSKTILRKATNDIKFRNWLCYNRKELCSKRYYVNTVIIAYKTGQPLQDIQFVESHKNDIKKQDGRQELMERFKDNLKGFFLYLENQKTNFSSYYDYYKSCKHIGLNMNEKKNVFPKEFKKWHDIRIDQSKTKRLAEEKEEHEQFVNRFSTIASKYLALEKNSKSPYMMIIAKTPDELVQEGETLKHCVGSMNYDQKFAREESLIFFVRTVDNPTEPFVTVEYSPSRRTVLQCYGYHDREPQEDVTKYVYKNWLPYANKQLSKIQMAA